MHLIILLGVIIGTASAVPHRASRIVGGSPTDIARYPYMSNMQHLFNGNYWVHLCGGSLLTSRTVLSAAQCYYSSNATSMWRVRLGASYLESGIIHEVSRIVIHENYLQFYFENDLAIVHLLSPAVMSTTVGTAVIAGNNYRLPDGAVVTAVGWGSVEPDQHYYPQQLHHVDINIINQRLCAERYAELHEQLQGVPEITAGMVCHGILDTGGKDVCANDIGGPLVYQNDTVVYGVISWGFFTMGLGCGQARYPTFSTRTAYYSDWIVANGSV